MPLEIERVTTDKGLREFIKVPWIVYQNDPNWVPWLYFERLEFFDKSKNPFFEHAEGDYFIARRDGRPVGVIAAVLNHRHNEFQQENAAHFGVFEVLNDSEAAACLLETACTWARERGADKIIGPANLSSNDEFGMLIEGFDSPPLILTTYNPRYYLEMMEAAGFRKAMDLLAWKSSTERFNTPGGQPKKMERVINKVKERYGLTLRPLNMKDWDNEIERVKKVYNSAWERNWGFVPMTDGEIYRLAEGLKPIIDPAIAFFVEKDGEAVGFCLSLPDVNQLLHKYRPGPSLISSYLAAGRMILNRRKPNWIRVIALGVIEEYRIKGVEALLIYETSRAAAPRGYQWGEASWILETNDLMNRAIEMMGAEVYKKYRVYEKDLK